MSLFELPVARSARVARVAAVLILDVVLAGSGIAMGLSWWSARNAAAAPEAPSAEPQAPEVAATPEQPEPAPPEVQVEEPRAVPRTQKPPGSGAGAGAGAGSRPQPPIVPPAWPGSIDAAAGAPPSPPPAPEPAPASVPDSAPAPAPEPEPIVDDGSAEVSSEAVRNVVHQHMGDVKRCYTRNAKVGTHLQPIEGKVEIQFTIRTTGDAEEVRVVENSTGSEALGTCVAALLSSWKFPSPGEDVEFVWPFVFKAPK